MNKNTIRKILNEATIGTNGGFSGVGFSTGPVGIGSSDVSNAAFISDSGGYGVTDNAQFKTGFNKQGEFIVNPWAYQTAEEAIMIEMQYKWNMVNSKSPSNDAANDEKWRAMVQAIPRSAKDLPKESTFADLDFTPKEYEELKGLVIEYIGAADNSVVYESAEPAPYIPDISDPRNPGHGQWGLTAPLAPPPIFWPFEVPPPVAPPPVPPLPYPPLATPPHPLCGGVKCPNVRWVPPSPGSWELQGTPPNQYWELVGREDRGYWYWYHGYPNVPARTADDHLERPYETYPDSREGSPWEPEWH